MKCKANFVNIETRKCYATFDYQLMISDFLCGSYCNSIFKSIFKVKVGQCFYEGYGNNPTSYRGAILPQQDGKDSFSGGLHVA